MAFTNCERINLSRRELSFAMPSDSTRFTDHSESWRLWVNNCWLLKIPFQTFSFFCAFDQWLKVRRLLLPPYLYSFMYCFVWAGAYLILACTKVTQILSHDAKVCKFKPSIPLYWWLKLLSREVSSSAIPRQQWPTTTSYRCVNGAFFSTSGYYNTTFACDGSNSRDESIDTFLLLARSVKEYHSQGCWSKYKPTEGGRWAKFWKTVCVCVCVSLGGKTYKTPAVNETAYLSALSVMCKQRPFRPARHTIALFAMQ